MSKTIKSISMVEIDDNECLGCQTCVELCPDIFEFNKKTLKCQIKNDLDINFDDYIWSLETCARYCPLDAIDIVYDID